MQLMHFASVLAMVLIPEDTPQTGGDIGTRILVLRGEQAGRLDARDRRACLDYRSAP